MKKFTLHAGNSAEVLKQYPDNHFDSVVTDPPYLINFLGKAWDSEDTDLTPVFKECFRVLKPGAHLLAFSAARSYHWMAIMVENSGFEIRDQIMWLYSSGFPKSQDVGKFIQKTNKNSNSNEWLGWGTALKPAHEPIVMARKPLTQSVAKNIQQYKTGALNIDATRVEGNRYPSNVMGEINDYQKYFYCPKISRKERHIGYADPGPRHPGADGGGYQVHNINSEVITNGNDVLTQKEMLDEMGGYWIDAQGNKSINGSKEIYLPHLGHIKAHGIPEIYEKWCIANDKEIKNTGNNHPTVKPQALMNYLIKLVTPANGRVLDPFNGSGSTGMAAVKLGHEYVGIDMDQKYIDISEKRIEAWTTVDNTFEELFEIS